ncbi:MAG: hypothetical protein RH949_31775 [Coleofasciculus sp. A1-SPW-01]|uniref:hypothetical protein n=1 Tax=Coleofasciculus sp. A1-SPW-01 TaxID=3070819 RepID=UPI0033007E87
MARLYNSSFVLIDVSTAILWRLAHYFVWFLSIQAQFVDNLTLKDNYDTASQML